MFVESIADPFRSFTATPLIAVLNVMGREVVLETNSPLVRATITRAFAPYDEFPGRTPQFRWKIICDPSSALSPPLSARIAFSDENLRFVNFNQRSFLAIDLGEREAVAFVSEEMVVDEMGFLTPFLSDLFDLTASALGLTEIMAGCVGCGDRGILVFGDAQSGKSTSAYLATKLGLELHADQVTCMELANGDLRAWGQFWPAAFRPDTLEFLPELKKLTRPFGFRDLSLWCLELNKVRPAKVTGLAPACCVFLERTESELPSLTMLSEPELSPKLFESIPFTEEKVFMEQQQKVIRCLAQLPAYRLRYPANPRSAALIYPELLKCHSGNPHD